MAATKRVSWSKVPHYILAQFMGAFAGAGLVFADFHGRWLLVDPHFRHSAGAFCTFPTVDGFWPCFFDQVVGSAILLGLIFAVVDKFNTSSKSNLAPLIIGLIVVAIGISFGGMNGYAINPARDFAPRLFAAMAGIWDNGLTNGNSVWLPPVIGPIVGGLLGAFAYDFLIGNALAQANIIKKSDRAGGMDPSYREKW